MPIRLVSAGQSDRGMEFAAQYCDYNFILGEGVNEPRKCAPLPARMQAVGEKAGRDVGSYVLYMLIAEETEEEAWAKWELYLKGADKEALAYMFGRAADDKDASGTSMAASVLRSASGVNWNMGTLVGSHEQVARMLDDAAGMPGVKGLMLTFDDFIEGMDKFGQKIQPLMRSRAKVLESV